MKTVNDNGETRKETDEEALEQKLFEKAHPEWFVPNKPTSEERLAALEEAMLALMMGGGN